MKNKLIAAIRKETLILLRDRIGLTILFVMPMILILVMTLIQDSAFKSVNEKGIPIVFVDNDHDSLGISIFKGLKNSPICFVTDSINEQLATEVSAKKAVAKGEYLIGIVIPKGATQAIRKNVAGLINETMGLVNTNPNDTQSVVDSVNITMFIDPVTKKSFITSITSNIHEFIATVKTQIMFQSFGEQMTGVMPAETKQPQNTYAKSQIINYKEIYASDIIGEVAPSAVQHNVPAWTIFGMFFIVIPIVGSIMKEKKEGSAFRLHTMPTSYLLLIHGKIMVYVIVSLIQFALMLSVGLFILPLFGLPVLQLGNSIFAIFIIAISTSFAATGYGVLVGTLASSEQQGAILGSLSILLLSALGGILVPTYIMPDVMRGISKLSPLNWSLEGFYKLFFRGAGVSGILMESGKLMLFFLFTMSIAAITHKLKRKV
ncbi:MAG: ABC transporter permease [Chitinophagaceae bacterium]|nr:ABC transporter permease [Chitinophagaceae bacterium]